MNTIAKLLVAALLLTGSAAGILAPAVNPAPVATPATVTTTAASAVELTASEAIAIALERAGLTREEVEQLKSRREKDDGTLVWDVEFRHGHYEYDCTIHAYTGAILEWDKDYDPPKTTPTEPPVTEPPATEPPATQPPAAELTTPEALAIALADAGLTTDQITNIRTRQEKDDGVLEWELEFRCGDYEYDYTIHAYTGAILKRDRDYDPQKAKPSEPEVPTTPTQPQKQPLTATEARTIALAHAGLTAEDVIFEPTERDRENGRTVYEVEFRAGKWEYSYEIDAETGKILEWEKEIDD